MIINSDTKLYCLIGNPIKKSLSPVIHNTSFELNKFNCSYLSFKVEKENLYEAINGIKALGIRGFNVTIPFKEEIIKYLDDIDEIAYKIKAVNTVINKNGKLTGYNTDGLGFIEPIKNLDFKNTRVLIVGAGGASRGISFYLAYNGIRDITIINRTYERAEKLCNEIKTNFNDLNISCEKTDKFIFKNNYNLIINTTSVGMHPNISETPLKLNCLSNDVIVYDIIYKPIETRLLKEAKEMGAKTINGLDMLINQALLSEEIWLDKKIKNLKIIEEIKRRIF